MADTLDTIGKILPEMPLDGGRDAVHVAVMAVEAGMTLEPDWRVGLLPDGRAGLVANDIGIVDPYLQNTVREGQVFWLFLYPKSITNLRHVWVHPSIDGPESLREHLANKSPDKNKSETWLRNFATREGMSYASLMEAVPKWSFLKSLDWMQGERIDSVEGFDIPAEFWDHFEAVSGMKVPENERGKAFSCSC